MIIENVAIVGLGALGIMYAKHFSEVIGKENVRVIVNAERKERYEKTGIYSNGERCDFNYVDEAENTHPADLVLFCVKGTTLESAIETAQNQIGPFTIIMSALNGISSEEQLADVFGRSNIVHAVAQGMDAVRDANELRYTKMGELRIGIDVLEKQARLDSVCSFFRQTGFPYTVESDIKHRIWKKFMMNVGINQVIMLIEGTYGDVQKEGPSRELMIAAMREVIMIANAEGVRLTEEDMQDNLDLLNVLSPDNMPSMRQDGLAKRYSEVALFSGTVLEKAEKNQLNVPTNQYLFDKITGIEATY